MILKYLSFQSEVLNLFNCLFALIFAFFIKKVICTYLHYFTFATIAAFGDQFSRPLGMGGCVLILDLFGMKFL